MNSSRLILHAPNVHCGGGLTLLRTLVQALPDNSHIIADDRLPLSDDDLKACQVSRIQPSFLGRLRAENLLNKAAKQGDQILCFGNLPPLFTQKARVILFLQNRYLVDNIDLSGFPLKTRLRITIERLWFKLFVRNSNQVVVQSASMKRLLEDSFSVSAAILPFVADTHNDVITNSSEAEDKKLYDFIYVASGEPHKNHRNLIRAWSNLAMKGVRPSLCLTLNADHFSELIAWIDKEKKSNGLNICNLGSVGGDDILKLYRKSGALVFPSTLESFGLPLIEAELTGLPIIASELDYVRDVVDPEQSFDPASPVSIARAVKRFLGETADRVDWMDANDFLKTLLRD